MTSRKCSRGTYRPASIKHSVTGVERINPGRPHSIVQKTAAIRIANDEIPMFDPYNHGSTALATVTSSTTNNASASKACFQPGNTASESAIGNEAPINVPI